MGNLQSRRSRRRSLLLLAVILGGLIPAVVFVAKPLHALASSAYADAVNADSPGAYWRLGESSGTSAADQTSNSNTATTHGTTTWGATGAIASDSSNNAISLNGSSGYLDAPDSSSLDPTSAVTVEAWVNPGSFDQNHDEPIVCKTTGTNNYDYQYCLILDDNGTYPKRVAFCVHIAGSFSCTGANNTGWTYGSWSHVAATYDGSHVYVYVNGAQVASSSHTGSLDTYSTGVDLGAYDFYPKTSTYLYSGGIDEAAVYGGALSSTRIAAHYNAGQDITAQSAGQYGTRILGDSPNGYWRLDETSGGHAADQTSHQNTLAGHGTLTWDSTPGAIVGDSDPAVSLDGSSAYLDTPDSPSLDPTSAVTVEAWVNPGSFDQNHDEPIVCKTTNTTNYEYQYCLVLDDSASYPKRVSLCLHIAGSFSCTGANNTGWTYGNWSQVAATYDGSHVYVYVNGVQVASSSHSGSLDTYKSFLSLGAYDFFAKTSTYLYSGGIDDAAVYPTALSAATIRAHYFASGNTPKPTDLVLTAAQAPTGSNFCLPCFIHGVVVGVATIFPINTESGNFFHSFADISIPGRSYPLEVVRTYNSQNAATNGPFGYGWNYNYGMSLSCSGTTATITQEDSSQVSFTTSGSCSSGTWTAAAPHFIATLSYASSTWTFKRQGRDTYTFNSSGQLTSETDANGYTTNLTYSGGNLTTITDPASRTLTLGWTGSHITSLTDANITPNRTVNYTYSSDQLTDVTDVAGGDTHFAYDGSHRVTTMKDPVCEAIGAGCPGVQNHYDGSSRVDWQKDALNRETTFAYSGDPQSSTGGTTTITDPKGNVVVDAYQWGLRTSETKGYGTGSAATTSFMYDPDTLALTGVQDPNGNITTYTVDSSGNVLTATDPLGRVTTKTYNAFNEVLTSEDGNGKTTTNTYDSNGNLATTSRPVSGTSCTCQVTTYNHANGTYPGDVTSVVDPDSKTTYLHYDSNGYLDQTKDPLGNVSGSEHNADGWVLNTWTPKAACTWNSSPPTGCSSTYKTVYSYIIPGGSTTDEFGDVQTITDPLSHVTTIGYDANRNKTSLKDGNGNTTSYTFDVANELTTTTRPDSGSTTLSTAYNDDGTVHTQTDGAGNVTTYTYDPLARVTQITDPATGNGTNDPTHDTTNFTYDTNGNRLTMVQGSKTTTYTYDADNEMCWYYLGSSSNGCASAPTNAITFSYDSDGQRTGMTDGTGTSSWTLDNLHRVTQYQNGNGNAVSYSYNLRNEPTTITYPGSHAVTDGYDDAGQVTSVQDWLSNTTSYSYDANGNLQTTTLPGTSNTDNTTVDAADNLTAINDTNSGGTVFYAKYGRDSNSQVCWETSASQTGSCASPPSSNVVGTYGYSALNQVCYADTGTPACSSSSTYTYDAADNLTKTGSTYQTYDGAQQLCWGYTSSTACSAGAPGTGSATRYTYDTRGNQTAATPYTSGTAGTDTCYGYDQLNHLTSVKTGTGTTCTSSTTVATYGYDGDGLRQSKTTGSTTQYTWSGAGGLPLLLEDGSTYYIYGPGGQVLEQINGSTPLFYHADQIGSVRAVTDASGTVQATYQYDPYGTITASTNPGSITNPFQFSGEYTDASTGLVYLRARDYNPLTGTFMQRDPAVASTRSAYGYALGSPLANTDPSGLDSCVGSVGMSNVFSTSEGQFVEPSIGCPGSSGGGSSSTGLSSSAISDAANLNSPPDTNGGWEFLSFLGTTASNLIGDCPNILFAKGGKQKVTGDDLAGISPQDLKKMYDDPNTSSGLRQKIKRQLKGLGQYGKSKGRLNE